jgi:hypothetical protein
MAESEYTPAVRRAIAKLNTVVETTSEDMIDNKEPDFVRPVITEFSQPPAGYYTYLAKNKLAS